jgi:hypothetical protein
MSDQSTNGNRAEPLPPTPDQLEARRTPPSQDECLAARRSNDAEPRLCLRLGIPRSVIEGAESSSVSYSHSPNIFYRRILEHLYPPGTRVTLLRPMSGEKNPGVGEGSEGTLEDLDDQPSFKVNWDSGSRLGLLIGVDEFVCDPPSGDA